MLAAFIRLVRFPNLIIVALTQFLLQYLVIIPAYLSAGISAELDLFHFTLLVIDTILIAMGGYVINDIFDVEIDKINKPDKMVIGKKISIASGWNMYYVINIVGFLIAIYLAVHIDNLPLLSLYPIASIALYFYSKTFKKSILIGNIIVAIFCAFVAGIVWFAERHSFTDLFEKDLIIALDAFNILSAYLVFAFLSTLIRELIKDMEDIEGDRLQGCNTFPIAFGIKAAKGLTILTGCFLIAALIWWMSDLYTYQKWTQIGFVGIGILLPLLYILLKLPTTDEKEAFHKLSSLSKYLMLSGIIYLFIN